MCKSYRLNLSIKKYFLGENGLDARTFEAGKRE